MKDIEQAITDTLSKQKKQPSELLSLNLDSKCKATHVKGLDAFVNLKSLSLSGIGLASLEGFPALPHLTALTLSDNRITGGLTHLVSAGLTALRSLDLAGNRIAKAAELEPLKELKQLCSLDLHACPVSTEDLRPKLFAMLDELKYLNGADKEGNERDGDEEGEDAEEEDAGEEQAQEGGGEGDEPEYEDDEGEDDDDEKEYAILVGDDAVGEDEEGDYVDEGEGADDDDDDDEGEDEQPSAGGQKRKREGEEEAEDE